MAPTTSVTQHSDTSQPSTNPMSPPKVLDKGRTTVESITQEVHAANSNSPDRLKFIFKSLINHLHAFVSETAITTEEWMEAIQFLTETGKTSTDVRQEFILLSDLLGVSTLVDIINNPTPPGATESAAMGPFYVENAQEVQSGDSISSEGKGDYLFVEGRVLDVQGNPIPGAIIDTWETDGFGQYDVQSEDPTTNECRGRLHSAADGSYAFRAVVPVPYPIPDDGPVGKLIKALNRQAIRPAHLHFRIEAPGYKTLGTALYWKEDPYIMNDPVLGVRSSLIVDPEIINDVNLTLKRGFKEAWAHAYLKQDFVLAMLEECECAKNNF